MSIDPGLERYVLAESALRARRAREHERSCRRPRALAERLHHGRHDLLAHLRRVAYAVPERFRSVAWSQQNVAPAMAIAASDDPERQVSP
jgi:hypothetical protein